MNIKFKIKAFIWKKFFNIVNVFTISFDQFNASKLNKIIALYCNFY